MVPRLIANFFMAVCFFLVAGLADSAPRNFSGTYQGDDILITISGDGPEYTGTIEMAGKKYPFPGTARGEKLGGKKPLKNPGGRQAEFGCGGARQPDWRESL